MPKAPNYTPEMTAIMIEEYTAAETDEARAAVVEDLAARFEKKLASIRQKLSREGVYVKATRVAKDSQPSVTKAKLVSAIADRIGVPAETFESLEKATKPVLQKILAALPLDETEE